MSQEKIIPTDISPKQRLALVTLAKELLHQVNEVSCLKRNKMAWEQSMQVLRDMALVLEYIPEHLRLAYLDMLPVIASDSTFPSPLEVDESFVNLSLPYKKTLIDRLCAELLPGRSGL